MSANLVSSIGYSLGKLHTGLLAYLCDLHRSGETEPLEALFRGLGVRVPSRPTPRREWNSVDLAIFEGDAASPCILIEMKVDDHEHGEEAGDPQTIRYATAHPNCESCLFITLGMGEYFNEPCDKQRFRWIRLRDFIAALDLVPNGVPVVEDWKRALHNEVDLQERAWRNDRSRLAEYRAGTWNIYVLGWIQKALSEMHLPGIGPRCFTCGSRPDTILNLGWNKSPYLEINNNGRLTGCNTDWLGLILTLKKAMPVKNKTCVIIGAGGTARAAAYGIMKEGGFPIIVNRTLEKGKILSGKLNCPFYSLSEIGKIKADCLINTTPVGMFPHQDKSPVKISALAGYKYVMDVIYNPLKTKLLADAEKQGCHIFSGLDMFVNQGAEQFRLWTGKEPPRSLMKKVILERLTHIE